MKSIKKFSTIISGLFIIPSYLNAEPLAANQIGTAMMRLQATPFYTPNLSSNVWLPLRQDFQLNEVNSSLIRTHENSFAKNKAYFNRTLNRSKPYMYHILQEVQKRGMPTEIALLPFIESAYVTKARSPVGASGLWQFMPATGRHYGLEQTFMYDGRHDIFAATNAALDYLQYLYGLFGDWSLALAAYNWGEGNVGRAIKQAQAKGLAPTYENLRMPNETRNYVPKLLAVRNLINNPQLFGVTLPEIKNEPYFQAVEVSIPMDITTAALLADIPENEFLALNPAFKTPVFVPKGKNRMMLLPVTAVKTFENNFKAANPQNLLSWDVFTPDTHIDLTKLSRQTGISVSEIKRLNGIRGNKVQAGKTILLSRNSLNALPMPKTNTTTSIALDTGSTPDTFIERKPALTQNNQTNDIKNVSATHLTQTNQQENSADPIMQLAYTASQRQQLATNSVKANLIKTNFQANSRNTATTKNTPRKAQRKVISHKVRAGDTLYSIAKRYNTDINSIINANKIKGSHIKLGQTLKITVTSNNTTTTKNKATANKKSTNTQSKTRTQQKSYTVRKGDTLESIAKRYNVKVNQLKKLNNNSTKIKIGQTIKLP